MTHNPERTLSNVPTNPAEFFPWLKETSERAWATIPLKENIYGFQIQAGTRWNPGLSTDQIRQYEATLGFTFSEIFKQYLKVMNGTEPKTINIYARREPPRYGSGFYAYPQDLEEIKDYIQWIYEECHVTPEQVDREGIPHIIPIIGHRFLVVDRCPTNPVLSMHGSDIIPYSANLMNFLVDDIFFNARQDPSLPDDLEVKFWLNFE